MTFGFDLGSFVPAALMCVVGVAIYYVRSSVEAAAAAKVATAMTEIGGRVEVQASALMGKIDALKDAIASMTSTLRINEERHKVLAEDVLAHDRRLVELHSYAHAMRHEFANQIMRHHLQIELLEKNTHR